MLMSIFVVTDCGAVGYECHDHCMSHDGWPVINPLSIGGQRQFNHYGFAQFVAASIIDLAAAYLVYLRSGRIDWTSLRQNDYWFPYTFNDGPVH